MIVRELITQLSFRGDHKQADKYDRAIQGLRRTAMLAAAAVGAIGVATTGLVRNFSESSAETLAWANRLGIATGRLQELGFAAKQYRITNEALIDGIKELSLRSDEFAKEGVGGAVEAFKTLGFSQERVNALTGDTALLFDEVRKAVSGIENVASRQRVADELFGGQAGEQFTEFLSISADEMERLTRLARTSGFVVSREDLERAREFSQESGILAATFGGLGKVLASALLPQYQALVESSQEFLSNNVETIKTGIKRFVDGLTTAMRGMWWVLRNVVDVLDVGADVLGGWRNTLRLVITAVSTMVGIKLASWLWAATTGANALNAAINGIFKTLGFFALSLLIDDLIQWVKGNKSALGEVLGDWEDFKRDLQPFVDFIKAVGEILMGVFTLDIDRIMQGFRELGSAIVAWGKQMGIALRNSIASVVPEWMRDMFSAPTTGLAAANAPAIAPGMQATALREGRMAAQAAGFSGGQGGGRTVSNRNEINITAANLGDPAAQQSLAEQIGMEIDRRTRQSANQFPDAE